jgi:ankyrin repeat protein
LGRTALHAAVSSRSAQCVEIVLECAPLVADKVTHDERNTPLHTAVRFVSPKCVSLILDEYPSLASQKNVRDQYPLDMARDIHNNWLGKVEFMRGEGRATGSLQELETIVELLSAAQR